MHMVSEKDLNSSELETMRTSRSPTTVMTANGEVQTREEAAYYVKQLDLFVKVMLLEGTPAVLSLVKLCEDHGYTYHWIGGPQPHLIRNCVCFGDDSHRRDARHSHPCEDRRDAETD